MIRRSAGESRTVMTARWAGILVAHASTLLSPDR